MDIFVLQHSAQLWTLFFLQEVGRFSCRGNHNIIKSISQVYIMDTLSFWDFSASFPTSHQALLKYHVGERGDSRHTLSCYNFSYFFCT